MGGPPVFVVIPVEPWLWLGGNPPTPSIYSTADCCPLLTIWPRCCPRHAPDDVIIQCGYQRLSLDGAVIGTFEHYSGSYRTYVKVPITAPSRGTLCMISAMGINIIWGMCGVCLGQHLGHIINNGRQSAVLHASVMPFFSRENIGYHCNINISAE